MVDLGTGITMGGYRFPSLVLQPEASCFMCIYGSTHMPDEILHMRGSAAAGSFLRMMTYCAFPLPSRSTPEKTNRFCTHRDRASDGMNKKHVSPKGPDAPSPAACPTPS